MRALSFNGSTFTLIATYDTTGTANATWGDGTYIYVADGASGIHAFTFNGSSWTFKATYNSSGTAVGVWGAGGYIYLGDTTQIIALSFNGTSWTAIDSDAENGINDMDRRNLYLRWRWLERNQCPKLQRFDALAGSPYSFINALPVLRN